MSNNTKNKETKNSKRFHLSKSKTRIIERNFVSRINESNVTYLKVELSKYENIRIIYE